MSQKIGYSEEKEYKKEKRVISIESIYIAAAITTFLSLSLLSTFIFWR